MCDGTATEVFQEALGIVSCIGLLGCDMETNFSEMYIAYIKAMMMTTTWKDA